MIEVAVYHAMLAVAVVLVGVTILRDLWRQHVSIDELMIVEIAPSLAAEIERGDIAVVMHARKRADRRMVPTSLIATSPTMGAATGAQ